MTRKLFLFVVLFALAAPQVIPQTPQPAGAAAAQPAGFGTIQGTVVREGTTDPIPDVQITLTGRGGISVQDAQTILNVQARGGVINLPPEILQAVQEAVRGGQPALTAVSDSAGQFTIRNVPAGTQTLRAQLEGYFAPVQNGQYSPQVNLPVTVAADNVSNIKVIMLPGGTISGRVFDPSGKPVSDAPVQVLLSGYQNGVAVPQVANIKQTNDLGEYRMYRLPPGEYFVAASPRPQALQGARGNAGSNPQEVQVPTYYPNVTDESASVRIPLRSGDDLAGVNIQMRTAPGMKVSGHVTSTVPPGPTAGPRGQTRTGGVMLVSTHSRGLLNMDAGGAIPLNADGGDFEFQNVAPGTYDVIARISVAPGGGWGPQAPPATATGPWAVGRVAVDVRSDNVNNVSLVVRSGVDVKGHVLLNGSPTRANVRISVQQDESTQGPNDQQLSLMFNQIRQYQAPIGDDGSFTIPLLPEGRYRFQVSLNAVATAARGATTANGAPPPPALPLGTFVADIRQGGTSVYDNGLVVGTEPTGPVEVLLSTSAGSLEGSVTGADQKPAANMTVVLVPPENRRQNPALYRTARSDAQGRFRMGNIPSGSYTVYAWESVPSGAYQNAEFMARYAGRGTPVTVAAGAPTTASVNAILENSSGR
jgi:hypothetical protein